MVRERWQVLLPGLGLVVQACGVGSTPMADTLDLASLPSIEVVETAVIGGFDAEGADALGSVTSVSFLADDAGIVVADGAVQEIHLFSLAGVHLLGGGGGGGGPGEFTAVGQTQGLPDGRVGVWDPQASRSTLFGSHLDVPEAHVAGPGPVLSMFSVFVGYLPDGRFVLRDQRDIQGMRSQPEGMLQDTVRLYLYAATGEFLDTVAVLPDVPKWFRNRDNSWGAYDLIFGRQVTSLVVGNEVWVGATGTVSFTRYAPGGGAIGHVDLAVLPRIALQGDIEAERARLIAAVEAPRGNSPMPPRWMAALSYMADVNRQAIGESPSHDTLPAYDSAVSGADGVVWLRQYPRPEDTTALWLQLDSAGEARGTLSLSRDTNVMAATGRRLALLEKDAWDAPVIRLLIVVRGPGGPE